jgi:hypothetical protein
MTETDPGVQGTKLSKSGDNQIEARNKSYLKVLDAQNNYIRAQKSGAENEEELYTRWKSKSAWHEKEYGW